MKKIKPNSQKAAIALTLVKNLQKRFVDTLTNSEDIFTSVDWLRDEGLHGGGVRFCIADSATFNRASVNVSQIYYDDLPKKNLGSATALSAIIHPQNPHAPSMHIHISWTEMKDGKGYWRIMADLNPSIQNNDDKLAFENCLKKSAAEQYEEGSAQGDKYFFIPALNRHRGVSHFYLEGYKTENDEADLLLAQNIGEAVIHCYSEILKNAVSANRLPKTESFEKQLAYHTLYLFQVLTLDRGTTSGLLIHNQNDIGIMGSIPAKVNKNLLASWKEKLRSPQDELLQGILNSLPDESPAEVCDKTKISLANAVRNHYKKHPEALKLQASGNLIPNTVKNHESSKGNK